MEFIYALNLAISDLKRNEIQKIAIINGIFWAVFWLIGAFLSWDIIKAISAFIINLLPFKFIQDAGANFIVLILWIQAILITVGVVFSLFNKLLTHKLYPLITAIVIGLFWTAVFLIYKDPITAYLQKLLRIFPFETVEDTIATILAVFILYSFYVASVYVGFLIFSAKTLENIKQEEYPDIESTNKLSYFKLVLIMLRDLILFIIVLFAVYPLLFIPIVNILTIIFLWGLLIKESLYHTVKMLFGKTPKKIWLISIISVFFNFIPLINIYAPAIGELITFRYVFEKEDN